MHLALNRSELKVLGCGRDGYHWLKENGKSVALIDVRAFKDSSASGGDCAHAQVRTYLQVVKTE